MPQSMIGYFTLAGDIDADTPFGAYRQSFAKLVKQRIGDRRYGDGLDLILIKYYLEGKYLHKVSKDYPEGKYLHMVTKDYRVQGYRKKEKSVAAIVYVARSFAIMPETDKRQFIIDSTLEVIRLVHIKMDRLGFKNIDFDRLTADMRECAGEYINLDVDLVKFAWPDA